MNIDKRIKKRSSAFTIGLVILLSLSMGSTFASAAATDSCNNSDKDCNSKLQLTYDDELSQNYNGLKVYEITEEAVNTDSLNEYDESDTDTDSDSDSVALEYIFGQVNVPASVNTLVEQCGTRYGYDHLPLAGQKEYYTDMYNCLTQTYASGTSFSASDVYFSDGSTQTLYLLDSVYFNTYGITFTQALDTYYYMMYDNPIFFFVDNTVVYSSNYIQIVANANCASGALRNQYKASINNILDQYDDATANYTMYNTAKYVHDQIATKIRYAYDTSGQPQTAFYAHSIIGYIDDSYNEAVCEGYAKTYNVVLNYLGLNCVYVMSVDHAWNMVLMPNNKYYYVDVTWDDQPSWPGGVIYNNFMKGSASFETETSHIPCDESSTNSAYRLYSLDKLDTADFDTTVNYGDHREGVGLDIPTVYAVEKSGVYNVIQFETVGDASQYAIYRAPLDDESNRLVIGIIGADSSKSVMSYTDKTPITSEGYMYWVEARNGSKNSGIGTGMATLDKVIVKNVNHVGATTNTIYWSRSALNDVQYIVYRKISVNGAWSAIATITNPDIVSYKDTKAAANVVYEYAVRVDRNKYGYYTKGTSSAAMKSLNITTVTKVRSTTSKSNVVYWNAVDNATSYKIYRKVSGGSFTLIGSATASQVTYTDSTADNRIKYFYYVRAYRTCNGISAAGWYNTSGVSNIVMPTVTSVTSITYNQLKITWAKNSSVTGYVVYRRTANGSWTKLAATTNTYYLDTTCTTGTTYYYSVRAYIGSVNETFSYFNAGKSGKAIPKTPLLSKISTTTNCNSISWNSVYGANGYYVYRKTANTNWVRVGVISGNSVCQYNDRTAVSGTTYNYTVRSYRSVSGNAVLSGYNTVGLQIKTK